MIQLTLSKKQQIQKTDIESLLAYLEYAGEDSISIEMLLTNLEVDYKPMRLQSNDGETMVLKAIFT